MFNQYGQRGMTLVELTVVLLILTALAGLAVPYISGTGHTAQCQTTDATMQAVKEAIMGGKAGPGFYGDTLGAYPAPSRTSTAYNLHFLFSQYPPGNSTKAWPDFNAKTAVGWRGPYLQNGAQVPSGLGNSFLVFSGTTPPPAVHVDMGNAGNQVLDSWRRPLVLQVPSPASCDRLTGLSGTKPGYCARLVSAGPGNGLNSGDAEIDTPIDDNPSTIGTTENARQNDDRILYLKIAPPANDRVNEDCV